jgi:two-component system sensor histidine kinase VicK
LADTLARDAQQHLISNLEAIHEVRRLNGTIKNIMERTCAKQSPGSPENANQDHVRAWKASELVSLSFDAMDVLVNPSLSEHAQKRKAVVYQVVDKVVRIYRPTADEKGCALQLTGRSSTETLVDRNTIHIIPSVFIDNAIKYSPRSEQIEVRVYDTEGSIRVEVRSVGPGASNSECASLFKTRVRSRQAQVAAGGSGAGLVVANRVAEMHGARTYFTQATRNVALSDWMFGCELPRP